MQLYGELHRYIPVLAHYRGYRVTELPVNHRPREHGRSNYGVERYVRGFLDLLTVTFMGRYRHRPLHLFGGLGLIASLLGFAILVYLTIVKLAGHAIGQRPLLTLGRPPRRRRHPAALARPALRADHEPPRGANRRGRPDRAARRRSAALERRRARPLLRHLRPGLPAERPGHLGAPRRGRRGREQHRAVWERRHNWSVGPRQLLRHGRGRVEPPPRRGTPGGRPTCSSSAIPATSTCRRRSGSRAGDRSSSIPLVSLYDTLVDDRGRFRRGVCRLPALVHLVDRRAFRRADVVVADTEAHATFFRDGFGLPPDRVEVCLVGAEDRLFSPGLAARRAVSRALRREADSPPRARDDPRRGVARTGNPVPDRRQRPARVSPRRRGPRTSTWVPWVEYERLPAELHGAGCALGIFGTGAKAARVIPNKAFQALACGTPLVTADTPAARELLTDGAGRAPRPSGGSRGARRGRSAARRRSRARAPASAPAAARRTRPGRARPFSASAGAACSSARSRRRDAPRALTVGRGRRHSPPGCRRSPCSSSERSRRAGSTSAT